MNKFKTNHPFFFFPRPNPSWKDDRDWVTLTFLQRSNGQLQHDRLKTMSTADSSNMSRYSESFQNNDPVTSARYQGPIQ